MKGKLGASKGGVACFMSYQDHRKQAQQLKGQGLNNTQIAQQLGVARMIDLQFTVQ